MEESGEKKRISLLGATGSIGTQTLDIIRRKRSKFEVVVLTCGKNIKKFREELAEFSPRLAVCADDADRRMLSGEFPDTEFMSGEEGLVRAAGYDTDLLVNALTGMRGLIPTYHAIRAGHDIALANKETLVSRSCHHG